MRSRTASATVLLPLLLLALLSTTRGAATADRDDVCTASGLDSGLGACLASHAEDDCCDFLINDIIYPCGTTEVCSLDLTPAVLDFFSYCKFKCRGLAADV